MNARSIPASRTDELVRRLADARAQLRALMLQLPEEGWLGPRAAHLNPPLWEYGHIVWFQERWCLRARDDGSFSPALVDVADALYDSSAVPHDTRWDLALLTPDAVDAYGAEVAAAVAERLQQHPDDAIAYYAELSLYHELMHIEAWWMAFQNLGYAPPAHGIAPLASREGRVTLAAGEVELGSAPGEGFVFDNEKWRHRVPVRGFDIDLRPVSETTYARFVDEGGYVTQTLWSEAGWHWRQSEAAMQPLYWRRAQDGWQTRRFDRWTSLDADRPMLHVNRYEAEACAAWMGRTLPSAAEWLHAHRHSELDSGKGWEWLRDSFAPYPGFAPDAYRDYSAPWFHTHWELRGGSPYTDTALKRPGFRNFYLPHRRDPFAGFRTVSRDPLSLPSST